MISYTKIPHQKILCIDMKSFFASCAAVKLGLDPLTCYLVVVGDINQQGSIVLAASPKMKSEFGIKTGNRLFEVPNDPRIKIVDASMASFLKTSTDITKLFYQFVPKECIHVYSIDESFLKIDGTERLWGSALDTARKIREAIAKQFQLPCSIGIGPNMLMAKLCLDLEAKKRGIAEWTYTDVKTKLWNVTPLSKMWGIGPRLERTLNRMGIMTVGQLANYPLALLEKKFGIIGNQLYYHTHGIDFSEIGAPILKGQVSFAKGQILLRDYDDPKEIKHVILEMCEEVARRARTARKCGRTVSLGIGYSKHVGGGGFYRSKTMEEPTNVTMDIYRTCLELFAENYAHRTVRKISVTLSNVSDDDMLQLSLFEENKVRERELGYVMDAIRKKHGPNAILRAVSYTKAGTARRRNKLIGGHQA
ncbi:Y-family DNA polymerase [Calidifontibacillus erzurumensis]|uniref:UV damage repair protein UvrX n=1 Tax=Calidifontibacillus erzurumensis TaxID=2741433 RepID=A0A8J8GBC7_9BACI|nr:UV damage repair protein UvrX [Calidifontibacillus erzurumensis]NSL50429.1 UV damage repair protein UvrX [Calidifontibacillus erzurumensis]